MAKYCANCNHLCENDDVHFCPSCGSQNFLPAAAQTPSPNAADPVCDNQQPKAVMPPVNTNLTENPRKKTGGKKIMIACVALCLVFALVIGVFALAGNVLGLFGSGKRYFASVEKKSVADFCDSFEAYYDNYLFDVLLNDSRRHINMSLNVSDELMESMTNGASESIDMSWINNTALDITVNSSGYQTSADTIISIDGQTVLSPILFADAESSKLLLKLTEITDDVLQFHTEESENDLDKQLLSQILPKSSVITKLITKYHGIFLKNIEKVEKTKEEVSLNGLSEKLTVLTCVLTENTMKDISLEMLNELKSDAEIKEIFENAQKALEGKGLASDSETLYDAFLQEIDKEIDGLNNKDADENTLITIKDYVNSHDEIVGRKIGENGETLDYLTVESGNNFAKYIDLKDGMFFRESGTKKGDRVTAECVFTENDELLYKINLTDFDTKAFKKGQFDGKIRMFPNSETVKDAAPDGLKKYSAFLDTAFDLDIKGDAHAGKFNLTLLNGENPLFETTAEYAITTGNGVTLPEGKVIEIKGLESLLELMGDLHLDQLVDNLRKTSVPKDYVDAIEELSNELKSAG